MSKRMIEEEQAIKDWHQDPLDSNTIKPWASPSDSTDNDSIYIDDTGMYSYLFPEVSNPEGHSGDLDDDNDEVVEKLYCEYPELTEAFFGIAIENSDLFAEKMLSYGLSNIALGTTMDTQEQRKMSLDGVVIRMMDKISRLKRLVLENKENTVPTESVKDTLADLANYAIIAQMVLENKWR